MRLFSFAVVFVLSVDGEEGLKDMGSDKALGSAGV